VLGDAPKDVSDLRQVLNKCAPGKTIGGANWHFHLLGDATEDEPAFVTESREARAKIRAFVESNKAAIEELLAGTGAHLMSDSELAAAEAEPSDDEDESSGSEGGLAKLRRGKHASPASPRSKGAGGKENAKAKPAKGGGAAAAQPVKAKKKREAPPRDSPGPSSAEAKAAKKHKHKTARPADAERALPPLDRFYTVLREAHEAGFTVDESSALITSLGLNEPETAAKVRSGAPLLSAATPRTTL